MLASPSNHEVFEAEIRYVNLAAVVAERTWFERRPDRWGLITAVWNLGWSLRAKRYDLGIDVRGDVLTVLVLALAGIPRRVGWSMGGGAFLLTDVAPWIPGRHEVKSRLALLNRLGITPDESTRVDVHVSDANRVAVARRLAGEWPRRSPRRVEVYATTTARVRPGEGRDVRSPSTTTRSMSDGPDWLHADRFSSLPPILAVHLGAGNAAKRWPTDSWKKLIDRFLEMEWRSWWSGNRRRSAIERPLPHERLRDWTGTLTVTETTALLERADLFIGSDSGLHSGGVGRDALGDLVQRDQSAQAVAAVVATFPRAPPPCSLSALPPEGLPARRPSLHVGSGPGASLPGCASAVVSNPPG